MHNKMSDAILTLALLTLCTPLLAQSLHGSRASMERQHQEAVSYGYTFLGTPQAVSNFVSEGHLVTVTDTQYLELHDVSYPYSRPEVKTFIERFSSQYYSVCGEKLVVTSLTRPIDEQPENAASDSVHPTGMAVDMHVPPTPRCRSWLERTLLSMEGNGLLDVTRERHPAHYHVAVFTRSYENYIAARPASTSTPSLDPAPTSFSAGTVAVSTAKTASEGTYTVRKGDTLASIAERAGTTASKLKTLNGMRKAKVKAGKILQLPASFAAGVTSSELKHRVRRGETLWRIANRYGTTTEEIKRENGLKDDVVNPGQVLRIRNSAARNSLASLTP
jgi:LysM repeat protein